jgi:simple sugar transport system permease protein
MVTMAAQLGIMAVGISFLMISGEFDLSVGSVYCFSPMILAMLVKQGVPPWIAILVGLLFAALIGTSNGIITLKMGIPSFITTLGMMMLVRGIILAITGGFTITYKPQSSMDLISLLNMRFGETNFRASAVWFILLVLAFTFVLDRTRYGNWVLATGGDQGTAGALGVNWKRTKLINFILCSVLAGFSGMVNMGRFLTIEADLGDGMELEAIAAAVIGGNLLSGGYGSVLGTLIGTSLVGMVRSGLVLAGAPVFWYRAFIGIILIIAVIINLRVQRAVMK